MLVFLFVFCFCSCFVVLLFCVLCVFRGEDDGRGRGGGWSCKFEKCIGVALCAVVYFWERFVFVMSGLEGRFHLVKQSFHSFFADDPRFLQLIQIGVKLHLCLFDLLSAKASNTHHLFDLLHSLSTGFNKSSSSVSVVVCGDTNQANQCCVVFSTTTHEFDGFVVSRTHQQG